MPDIEVPRRVAAPAEKSLTTSLGARVPQFRSAVVEYALALKSSHAISDTGFGVTPAMRDELYRRVQAKGVKLSRAVYDSAGPLVDRVLGGQVARYVFNQSVEFSRGLREDPAMLRAIDVLQGVKTPKELLARLRG